MKTWFVTGASRGFGREWAAAALERGDRVVATARDAATLTSLRHRFGDNVLALQLDVTDRQRVFDAVDAAISHFGTLDVVVNNAGYGQFGAVEELSEEDLRQQLETNFFGLVWVTQAVLPHLRGQGRGHILQVSSIGGVTAFPTLGAYHASKWAVEGISQALAHEVTDFGVKVTIIEPGGFATDWGGPSARFAEGLPTYKGLHEIVAAGRQDSSNERGDPRASARALLRLVDSDDPPLRVFFGKSALDTVAADYESRLETWRRWQHLAVDAHA